MQFTSSKLSILAVLLAATPVFSVPARGAKGEKVVVTTKVVSYPIDIDTTIVKKGTSVIAPSQITVTFKRVPTHFVLHTTATSITTLTVTKNAAAPTSAVTTAAATTTTVNVEVNDSSATTTAKAAIPTKTGVSNCNVQGTPDAGMLSNIRNTSQEDDVIACMRSCRFDTPCQSYSWNPSTSLCETYMAGVSVIAGNTGIYISAKYPSDGTDYCYGSVSFY